MWGCSYFSNLSGIGRLSPGALIVALLVVLTVVILVLLAVRRGRASAAGKSMHRDQNDSIQILSIRYARGEVDKDEYLRMKETLKRS